LTERIPMQRLARRNGRTSRFANLRGDERAIKG
jgi:hypothetical protein